MAKKKGSRKSKPTRVKRQVSKGKGRSKKRSNGKGPLKIGFPRKSANKLPEISFPLQERQKANLRDASKMLHKFSNIRSDQQSQKIQKGGGAWLQALLMVPELVQAVRYLTK